MRILVILMVLGAFGCGISPEEAERRAYNKIKKVNGYVEDCEKLGKYFNSKSILTNTPDEDRDNYSCDFFESPKFPAYYAESLTIMVHAIEVSKGIIKLGEE